MKRKMDMNRSGNKTLIVFMMLLFMSFSLFGCGSKDSDKSNENGKTVAVAEQSLYGHKLTGTLELKYSKEYSVSFYDGELTLIIVGEDRFLLIGDESGSESSDNDKNDVDDHGGVDDRDVVDGYDDIPEEALQDEKNGKLVILRKPLRNIYVASSSVMDYFDTLEALDTVTMTSTKAEDWSIEKIRQLVEDDEISYVGKYSMPDYEYILDEECGLAIENQMIYHSPETQEKLETLGIPVLVERSSLEETPLGRMEWIKLYGILTGRQNEAEAIFAEQEKRLSDVEEKLRTDVSVNDTTSSDNTHGDTDGKSDNKEKVSAVLYYINASGIPSVRNPHDYMVDLIKMSGAEYAFDDIGSGSSKTYINLQMEEFFARSDSIDVMIYNSNLGTSIDTIDNLIKQDNMLAEFKAVKNKNVWCYSQDSYQQPTKMPEMVEEMYMIFKYVRDGGEEPELIYFKRLK